MNLSDKVGIVTGGGRGIGRAIALRLAKEGADVVVFEMDSEPGIEVANEIKKLGRKALFSKVDVSKSKEVNAGIGSALDEFGKIDILVNNAGGSARERNSLFCDSTEEVWDHVFGKNVKGTFNCTRAVLNHMIERKTGKIVNIASAAGLVADYGLVDYSAAKAAVIGFTKALAKEVACHGITVNSVAPGPIASGIIDKLPQLRPQTASVLEHALKITGLNRLGTPEEIAAMVAFLVGGESNFITGQVIPVCGLRNLGGAD
jgi:3-oxoacyl-[acyl-carrier protein] reductase